MLAVWAAGVVAAQAPPTFEYLFTIGAKGEVNPKLRAAGPWSRLLLGAPERLTPLVVPAEVAVDPEERIWIADRGAGQVFLFDILGGKFRALSGSPKQAFRCPAGIDVDSMGFVYVADACLGAVFVFDHEGVFERMLASRKRDHTLREPSSIVISPDRKRIYVADPKAGRVVVLNQEGETVQRWSRRGKEELGAPTTVVLDKREKEVLVLDAASGSVDRYSLGGEHRKAVRFSRVRRASALAFDSETQRYFVGDADYEAVHVFDRAGDLIASFGQSGSGAGECRTPYSLKVDFAGRVYLTDALNGKVLVYRESQGIPLFLPAPK